MSGGTSHIGGTYIEDKKSKDKYCEAFRSSGFSLRVLARFHVRRTVNAFGSWMGNGRFLVPEVQVHFCMLQGGTRIHFSDTSPSFHADRVLQRSTLPVVLGTNCATHMYDTDHTDLGTVVPSTHTILLLQQTVRRTKQHVTVERYQVECMLINKAHGAIVWLVSP